ncbi:MAG: hypothetical protein F6J93_05170 [Oscillatoria sp. SIO1A7]|nr:hypothetical protein [Oscillatoria sp. SIO1A7]
MAYFEPKLPKELNTRQYWPLLLGNASEWSRIVAWTWTDCLAFAGYEREYNEEDSLAAQEQRLKTLLIQLMQRQAINTDVYEECGDPALLGPAEQFSRDIRNLFIGKNDEVAQIKDLGITITLSDVFKKFTGKELLAKIDPGFMEMFILRIITGSFIGAITYAPGKKDQELQPDNYILTVPYPPRPELSEVTVTARQLSDWAMNLTPGDSYLPPSAYFPWTPT